MLKLYSEPHIHSFTDFLSALIIAGSLIRDPRKGRSSLRRNSSLCLSDVCVWWGGFLCVSRPRCDLSFQSVASKRQEGERQRKHGAKLPASLCHHWFWFFLHFTHHFFFFMVSRFVRSMEAERINLHFLGLNLPHIVLIC